MTYFASYQASKTALVRFTECLALETKPFGVAAFSMAPGTVRSAMTNISVNSPEGQKWIPWFRQIFDEGLDVPPERAAELAVALASGKMDALSGRYVTPSDDLDRLLATADEIERDQLYTLRVRAPVRVVPHLIAAIRAAGAAVAESRLRVRRTFAAPREAVFPAFTDPRAAARWFAHGLHGRWARDVVLDARAGGAFDFELVVDDQRFHLRGTYREVRAPERLVCTWRWDADFPAWPHASETAVYVSFREQDGRTDVVLDHEEFPSSQARDAHERGWTRCFNGIEAVLG